MTNTKDNKIASPRRKRMNAQIMLMVTWIVVWAIVAPIALRSRWREFSKFSHAEQAVCFSVWIAVFAGVLILYIYRYRKIAREKDNNQDEVPPE
jgi:uncharacterized membrane protein